MASAASAQYVPPGYPQNFPGYPQQQQQAYPPSPYAAAAFGAAAYGQPGYGQPGYGAPMYGAPQGALLAAPGQLPGQSQAQFGTAGGGGGIASAGVIPVDPPGGIAGYNAPGASVGGIRADLLARSARSAGYQAGFEAEVARLNRAVQQEGAALERDFNFQALLVDGVVVPPVITEVREAGEQKSGKTIKLALGMFRIVTPARLSLKAPSWRDYAFINENFGRSRGPDFRPRTEEERRLYDAAVEDARADGIQYARELFKLNMARLVRDYEGMRLYHELAQSGAVSLPKVSRTSQALALSGDGTRANVGSMTVELVVTPNFKPASAQSYLGNRSVPPRPALDQEMVAVTAQNAVVASAPTSPPPAGSGDVRSAPLPPAAPPTTAVKQRGSASSHQPQSSPPPAPAGAPMDIRPAAPAGPPRAPAIASASTPAATATVVPKETQVVSLDPVPVPVTMAPAPAAGGLFDWLGPRPNVEPIQPAAPVVETPAPSPSPQAPSAPGRPAAPASAQPAPAKAQQRATKPAPVAAAPAREASAPALPPLPASTYEAAAAYEAAQGGKPAAQPVRPSATPAEAAAFIGLLSGGGR